MKPRHTIMHIASHTTNIGDGALIKGIQSTLTEDLNAEINFINHCTWDFTNYGTRVFDRNYVDWLNDNCEMLIIGGGGMIGGRQKQTSGINLPILPGVLKYLKVPVVFYALGHNLFPGQKLENAESLKKLILDVREINGLFSVRNDKSLDRLKRDLGEDVVKDVFEIPDPGTFIPFSPTSHLNIREDKINILVQLAGDQLARRSGGTRQSLLHRIIKRLTKTDKTDKVTIWHSLAGAFQEISEKHPINIILIPHILADLYVSGLFVAAAKETSKPKNYLNRAVMESTAVYRGTEYASCYFDIYRQADLVIGMRGHSSIVAVGAGTPFIGLVSHAKVAGYLEECGLSEWMVPLDSIELKDKLISLIEQLVVNPDNWHQKRNAAMEKMIIQRKDFHSRIKTLLA
jgi:polysaccharide pyruvyl transferase WcaK-like protein